MSDIASPEPSQNKILADGLYANERQRAKHFITQSRAAFVVSVYGVVAFTGVTFLFMAIYPDFSNAPVRWMGLSNDLRLMITVALAGFMGALVRQNLQFSRIIENQKIHKKNLISYFVTPLYAVPIALIGYMVVRGTILNSTTTAEHINSYGITTISFFFGLFADTVMNALMNLFSTESRLEGKIAKVEKAVGVNLLDNYDGYVVYEISPNHVSQNSLSKFSVTSGKQTLRVWFQSDPPSGDQTSERITISDGFDAELVTFEVCPAGTGVRSLPGRNFVTFMTWAKSAVLEFQIEVSEERSATDFWIEISQKNRFITMAQLKLL